MIVVAGRPHGEFRHVEAAKFDAAGGVELREHRRGVIGDKIGADFRAAAADRAGAIEHVLVRERHAMKRTERTTRFDGHVCRAGFGPGGLCDHADEAIERRLQPFDAIETGFDQRLCAQPALRNRDTRFAQRQRREIIHRPTPSEASMSSRR